MTSSSASTTLLLERAREGSDNSLGRLLKLFENYLRVLVLAQLEQRLAARVSPSDVVQETFYEAHRDFAQFRGVTTGEFVAWIRKILIHNLQRVAEQHVHTEKRDVRREVGLEDLAANFEQSAARLDAFLADQGASPSMVAERHELQIEVANRVAELPADYRDVIVLRHFRGLSFEAIGKQMDRSAGATRMLWLRAIKTLQAGMEVS